MARRWPAEGEKLFVQAKPRSSAHDDTEGGKQAGKSPAIARRGNGQSGVIEWATNEILGGSHQKRGPGCIGTDNLQARSWIDNDAGEERVLAILAGGFEASVKKLTAIFSRVRAMLGSASLAGIHDRQESLFTANQGQKVISIRNILTRTKPARDQINITDNSETLHTPPPLGLIDHS